MSNTTLSGVFPVLATPFRDDGSIDIDDFQTIVEFVLACGADGCVFPGVASEVNVLSPAERGALVALLGKTLNGRRPFIVGASDPDPEAVSDRIAEGARAGASAAMVMVPVELDGNLAAQRGYFQRIAGDASLPIMLQNAPRPAGAGLTPEAVATIASATANIRYVKEETLPCGQHLSRIVAAAGDQIDGVFGGAGGRYITDELARGALGTMPACELTDVHVALVKAWRGGDQARARRLFAASLPLLNFQAVFRMAMTKTVLRRRGIIRHVAVRAAGPVLDDGDRAELNYLLGEAATLFEQFPIATDTQS